MTARKHFTRKPVFFPGAIRCVRKQRTGARFWRASRAVLSVLISELNFWLTEGLWHVPRTLALGAGRWSLPVDDSSPSPRVDLYLPESSKQNQRPQLPSTTVLYVHGGAWGAGDSSHYAQLGTYIANKAKARVLILSYDLYPKADINKQVQAVEKTLLRIRDSSSRTILLAHSSGAQISALALLRHAQNSPDDEPLASTAILTAGPFDLSHHFLFESGRGIAEVSPMLPAACADETISNFDDCSPSVLAERINIFLQEVPALPLQPQVLEGNIAGGNICLPDVDVRNKDRNDDSQQKDKVLFPRTYILTSSCDKVVPCYSSIRFASALRKLGLPAHLLVYDYMEHVDFVTNWFDGAKPRTRTGILDIGMEEELRRCECLLHLKGEAYANIFEDSHLELGPTPYVRDVLRIIKDLVTDKKLHPDKPF